MFKNGIFFRKKSETGSLPDLNTPSTSSLKTKAAKFFGRAWNSIAYQRWFTELPSLKDSQSLFWLLGNWYSVDQKDDFRYDYMAKIWLSYRDDFPPLSDGRKTDFGWGCTLRSAQMLIAQALMFEKFGREWLRYDHTPSSLSNILRLFEDYENAPLGIHVLMNIAKKLDFKEPIGRWYSPSQAFVLLKYAIDQSHNVMLNDIKLLICVDNCVATDEIIESSSGWTKNVILIIPVRLGTEKVNQIYHDHIRTLFQMPHFLGIVGGRPRHAVYFVGYVENTLFTLDPHITQKYVKLDGTENDQHWETFHSKSIFTMKITDMDPSCALGFLIKNNDELVSLVEFLDKTGIADSRSGSSTNSLFSILKERPVYDSSLLTNPINNEEDNNEFELM